MAILAAAVFVAAVFRAAAGTAGAAAGLEVDPLVADQTVLQGEGPRTRLAVVGPLTCTQEVTRDKGRKSLFGSPYRQLDGTSKYCPIDTKTLLYY